MFCFIWSQNTLFISRQLYLITCAYWTILNVDPNKVYCRQRIKRGKMAKLNVGYSKQIPPAVKFVRTYNIIYLHNISFPTVYYLT